MMLHLFDFRRRILTDMTDRAIKYCQLRRHMQEASTATTVKEVEPRWQLRQTNGVLWNGLSHQTLHYWLLDWLRLVLRWRLVGDLVLVFLAKIAAW